MTSSNSKTNGNKATRKKNGRFDLFFRPSEPLFNAIVQDAEKNFGGNRSLTLKKRLGSIYNVKI